MPRCLFCLRDRDELTAEHVFPAALGAALVVEGTCIECVKNKRSFSKEFEQPVAVELTPLRNRLAIPDRYGNVPDVPAKAEVNGKEVDAKLLGSGVLRLAPAVTPIRGEDGKVTEILYENMTVKQKERIQREAAEKGYQIVDAEPVPDQKADVTVSGTLSLIGAPEGLRLATKIAYAGFARYAGPEFAIRNTSDEARTYVQTGSGTPTAKLFLNEEYLTNCAQGPHQHSIVLVGQNKKHRVDAIVRLFGALCYFVALSERYDGADFYNTLVYDAQRGEVDGVLVQDLQSEFLQVEHVMTSGATAWNDSAVSGSRLIRFVDDEIKRRLRAGRG
jgi:hypothetical protein